jgi:hypothetical protein
MTDTPVLFARYSLPRKRIGRKLLVKFGQSDSALVRSAKLQTRGILENTGSRNPGIPAGGWCSEEACLFFLETGMVWGGMGITFYERQQGEVLLSRSGESLGFREKYLGRHLCGEQAR